MLQRVIVLCFLMGCIHYSTQNFCTSNEFVLDKFSPETMPDKCHNVMQAQVQMELEAALTYLTMSVHFSHYGSHRPGAAKFFLENAFEEREHAKKLLHYMNMRGEKTAPETISSMVPRHADMSSLGKALESAITLEKGVTASIKKMIGVCSGETTHRNFDTVAQSLLPESKRQSSENDYQAVDYLTTEFLAEQIAGTRKIAEHISTLKRMGQFVHFSELMFDKTLLHD